MATGKAKNAFYNDYQKFEVDEGIVYPSYKSFDEFIDLEHLRSLDGFLTERIDADLESAAASYFCNLHRLEEDTPYQPGVREIWLARTKAGVPVEYADFVDRIELWEPTERTAEFEPLMEFIATLPFKATARILVIY